MFIILSLVLFCYYNQSFVLYIYLFVFFYFLSYLYYHYYILIVSFLLYFVFLPLLFRFWVCFFFIINYYLSLLWWFFLGFSLWCFLSIFLSFMSCSVFCLTKNNTLQLVRFACLCIPCFLCGCGVLLFLGFLVFFFL